MADLTRRNHHKKLSITLSSIVKHCKGLLFRYIGCVPTLEASDVIFTIRCVHLVRPVRIVVIICPRLDEDAAVSPALWGLRVCYVPVLEAVHELSDVVCAYASICKIDWQIFVTKSDFIELRPSAVRWLSGSHLVIGELDFSK